MAGSRPSGASRLSPRRWTFGSSVFDESNWTLAVDGRRVPIEAKPLELLRELLLRAGNVVPKDDLLDRIWPDVTVVEASLPTAVAKLRRALGDDRRADCKIVETVPGIGYRLTGPVEVAEFTASFPAPRAAAKTKDANREQQFAAAFCPGPPDAGSGAPPRVLLASGAGIFLVLAIALTPLIGGPAKRPGPAYTQRDAANALRKLDVGMIDKMLAAGWSPNAYFDNQGTAAIAYLLNMCEWNRDHDQAQMLLMVRTLLDGGARLDHRNVWGDTPYSIAKSQRYCGPDHPVTRSLRTMCYAGYKPLGDRCLATYEITRRKQS